RFKGKKPAVVLAQQDNWATPTSQRMGIRLVETRDPSGSPAYPVAPGDLLFFTNVGTSYGAKNTTNSVVVINAKTKKPMAMSQLDPRYTDKFANHGTGVSPDGRYIYLPSLASIAGPERETPNTTLVLDSRTLKIHQVIASGGPPHHVKLFRDGSGKQRMLVEDFNWTGPASIGKGFYVLDPMDNNRVVAGMLPNDMHGNFYNGFTTPDGKYLYGSMPPPHRGELISAVEGWMAKIDTENWKLGQSLHMKSFLLLYD